METRYNLEIQHLQHQAQTTEARHSVEIERLQQQRQTTQAGLTREIERLQQQAHSMEARHTDEIERLQQQVKTSQDDHSSERLKWFETLGAANDKAQQATARLDSYLLRQPIAPRIEIKGKIFLAPCVSSIHTNTHAGSRTRAALWTTVLNTPGNSFNVKLPTDPVTVATMDHVTAAIRPRLVFDFQREDDMYAVVRELIDAGLNHHTTRATVYVTSRRPYLGPYMPDLTIALPGTIEPDSFSVCVVVDMKFRSKNRKKDNEKLGTHDDFGQILDYLVEVQTAQQGRSTCVALLSDIKRNFLITLGAPGYGSRVVQYAADTLPAALAYIHDTALQSPSHVPPHSGFSDLAGTLRRRLGNPHHSVVGEFLVHGTTTKELMAVKRTNTKTFEKFFLEMFKNDKNRPECIPLLVFNNPDEIEYGITPVGTTLHAGIAASALQMRTILTDVISATKWLHGRRVVHRDIRCENIILVGSRATLIDFDCAYFLNWSLPTTYRGGKLCVPPAYLKLSQINGILQRYIPSFADDCFAIVLLVYCLLFPVRCVELKTETIGFPGSPDGEVLLQFWGDLQLSPLWNHYIKLAEGGTVHELLVLLDIFH